MVSGYETSDDEFNPDSFRIVRCRSPSKKPRPDADQEGAGGAVDVPMPGMVALSPDPPSGPMSGDGQGLGQPLPAGTDQEGADAVAVPMAMELGSPNPPPMSESGASHRSQPTWALTQRPRHTVESIFDDCKKRLGALVHALTRDEETFFQKFDPGMPPLHLYGGTDGTWKVKPPQVELPPLEPEPTPGLNIVRDTMERHEWMELVAMQCDAWLISVSSFAASNSCFTATERGRLYAMITTLPTVQEILLSGSDTYRCMYYVEEKSSSGLEANAVVEEEKEEVTFAEEKRSNVLDQANEVVQEEREVHHIGEQKKRYSGPTETNEVLEESEEDDTNGDDYFCASCGDRYNTKAFWICCSLCEKWYHGKCVNITSSQAEHIEDYECPDCYSDKVGHDND